MKDSGQKSLPKLVRIVQMQKLPMLLTKLLNEKDQNWKLSSKLWSPNVSSL